MALANKILQLGDCWFLTSESKMLRAWQLYSSIFLLCIQNLSRYSLVSSSASAAGKGGAVSKSTGPPAFFLQDPNDGLCLAGGIYKRCAIDTLWYVTGKPGSYQVHHRPVGLDPDSDPHYGECLDRMHCHLDESNITFASCNHCGAKKWNILGDAQTGYVLTEDGNKNCVRRRGNTAVMIKCDKGYSGLSLQFATKDDITAMSGDGARYINAATDNDLSGVKAFLTNKIAPVPVDARDWDNLTAVIAASGKGHLDMVKYLVQTANADISLKDKDNITALMEAAMGGHLAVVEFLTSVGAEVSPIASSGVSPLWLAAGEGHVGVVQFLLGKSADANNKRSDGITALMAASAGGHAEIVRALLAAGASVAGKDKEGLTALISAAENGSVPIVQLLLEHGAEVNVMSESGFSPLIIASAHGHLEVVKLLMNAGADMDLPHPELVTPLMYASAGGFPDLVKYLIEKGGEKALNARHKQGGSALMEAATAGNFTVFQILVDAGADPFITDEDGVTALMSAASQGHLEICKVLVAKGLQINQIAKSGGTALMFAAGGGHNETTRFLLDQKADVNIVVQATPEYIERVAKAIADGKEDVEPHKDGVTALLVACQGGHMGTAQMLVEAGAEVRVADDEDMTPLLTAIKGKYLALASYLLQHGADPNDVLVDEKTSKAHNLLMDAVVDGNQELAILLVEKGANLTYVDDEGVTIITQAAYQGQLLVAQALLAKGADPSVANKEGINAVIAAASEGHKDIVELLLKSSVDVNAQDKDGTNALMAAAVRGHKDVVKLLIDHGANVNAQNVDGHSALMFAYNGKNQVETLLDKYGEYMKEANDNSTKIIHDALQTHVDVVTLLLNNGADISLKDKEGHIAADFDYKAPEIVPVEGSITPPPVDKEL